MLCNCSYVDADVYYVYVDADDYYVYVDEDVYYVLICILSTA